MLTRLLFIAVILVAGFSILLDLAASRQNTRRLMEIGAQTLGGHQTRAFLTLAVAWMVGAVAEVTLLGRPMLLLPALAGITLAFLGRHLRRLARSALGQRWTLDIVSLPGNPLVTGQIYDRMRHPEYVGTFLLFTGVPLIHGAWFTAGATMLMGGALLLSRVRLEEAVLEEDIRYLSLMGDRPRFYPRRPRHDEHEPSQPTRLNPRGRGDQPRRV